MELRCQVEMNWYEVGKETPREGILLFMVTDKEPDLIYSGYYIQGSFRILGQMGGILMLKDSNVTHFAYMNNNMLPKNCKPGCLGSGWRLTKEMLPEDDEPVAIWPEYKGCRFAVWNKHEECWDDETADDFLCKKDEVEKWFPINWGGAN